MPTWQQTLIILHLADTEWYRWTVAEFGLIAVHEQTEELERAALRMTDPPPGTPMPRGRG